MRAPQYPKGLRLDAYRHRHDRRPPRAEHPQPLHRHAGRSRRRRSRPRCSRSASRCWSCCACSRPLHRWLRRLAVAAAALMPLVILADLQWRLYEFGHTLNPTGADPAEAVHAARDRPDADGQLRVARHDLVGRRLPACAAALLLWSPAARLARRDGGRRVPRCATRGSARRHARACHRVARAHRRRAAARACPPGAHRRHAAAARWHAVSVTAACIRARS